MFLNKTMFKKWIKTAFRSNGLIVGRIYDGLVLQGGSWATWTQEGYVPNWLKAAIMEHTGELPEIGQVFRAKKDEVSQYEISENPCLNLPERYREAKVPFVVIPVIYGSKWRNYRLFQCQQTGEVIPVYSEYYNIIDVRELEGEEWPIGPSAKDQKGNVLIWRNEVSALAVCRAELSEKSLPILTALKGLEYEEVRL